MADIHGITEALDCVKDLGVAGKEVLKDGKVDLTDLPVAMELVSHANDFIQAVKDAGDIPTEVKDLDAAESQALLAKLLEILAAIKAA